MRKNDPHESIHDRAIDVGGLHKSYGSVRAVRDVSFSVQLGEIVALLGPKPADRLGHAP